jgi:hypothetical protein
MTLQLLHSEYPYIRGKFYFIFYQCIEGEYLIEDSAKKLSVLKVPSDQIRPA